MCACIGVCVCVHVYESKKKKNSELGQYVVSYSQIPHVFYNRLSRSVTKKSQLGVISPYLSKVV
jgi:hypothetical protein